MRRDAIATSSQRLRTLWSLWKHQVQRQESRNKCDRIFDAHELDCIWQSQNLMMVLEGNRTSLALQLSASAERLIHYRETQKETREVTAQKGGRFPRTLLLARLINCMWSHSHQNCGEMIKEGKIPTMNYKTNINRTLGCHEEHRKGES